jgi:hypothetical protein
MLVLVALGVLERPDLIVFCDLGDPEGKDPGEWPSTYRHIREVAMPLCDQLGIEFVWLSSDMVPVRDARSVFAWFKARNQIPVSGPKRICTIIGKVERFEKYVTTRYPGQQLEVWVGFDATEQKRVDKDPNAGKASGWRVNRFPLIEQDLCRCRCEALLREAGYPVPRKSACVFCPYGSKGEWQKFAAELPEQFAQVVQLEADKPRTQKNNLKLAIMGFGRKRKDGTRAPNRMLPEYVAESYRKPKPKPCPCCGAAVPATKEAGCDYVGEVCEAA